MKIIFLSWQKFAIFVNMELKVNKLNDSCICHSRFEEGNLYDSDWNKAALLNVFYRKIEQKLSIRQFSKMNLMTQGQFYYFDYSLSSGYKYNIHYFLFLQLVSNIRKPTKKISRLYYGLSIIWTFL